MKAVMAVLLSFVFLALGWVMMLGGFLIISRVAAASGYSPTLGILAQVAANWFAAPAVSGYLAIAVSSSVVRSVPASQILAGFVAVISTISVIILAFSAFSAATGRTAWPAVIIAMVQCVAIVAGAWFGTPRETTGTAAAQR